MEPLSKLCQDEIAGADCQEVVTEEELVKGPYVNDVIIRMSLFVAKGHKCETDGKGEALMLPFCVTSFLNGS